MLTQPDQLTSGSLLSGGKPANADPSASAIVPDRTTAALLARNATLNLFTEGVLFVVLLVAMPPLVSHLGTQAFGLYALGWSVIGYLAYLELGVSRSTTQFVSKYLSQENSIGVRQTATTAILSNLCIGIASSIVVLLLAPLLTQTVFHIPIELRGQAKWVFYSVALAVPVVMLQAVFRAIAASYQEFVSINIVNAVGTAVQFALACCLAWKGFGVGVVVFSTVVVRIGFTFSYGVLVLGLVPRLFHPSDFHLGELRKLLCFGGWVTISQLILQMLTYLDRILLASFGSLSAVTYFTVPFEGITRLRVIPSGMMATVYPAMTESTDTQARKKFQALYENSVRYILVLLLPLICFIVVFGKVMLAAWMGAAFATHSALVFQILAVGFFLNSLAFVSYHAIQAVERPDAVGKYHLIILPVYIGLSIFLISHGGISGAAIAASLRFGLDALVLFWMAEKYCGCSMRVLRGPSAVRIMVLGILLLLLSILIRQLVANAWLSLSLGLLGVASYFVLVWHFLLNSRERPAVIQALGLSRSLKIV